MNTLPLLKSQILTVSLILNIISSNNANAQAQIIPDTTLSNENSVVTPNVNVKNDVADLIEGGAIRDANLFHSFLEFNVGDGQRVFFANPEGVVNILTRITGNNISEIFGTLGVNGNANLFLINPNGIVFGENATLDLNSSFIASTAESINFADGSQFSTTDTQTQPLLTVSIPVGLGLGDTPGNIINRSFATESSGEFEVGLQIQPGNTLALVGGEVVLEGGILTAEAGRIEIGSVAENNSVSLTPIQSGWTLNYEGVENFRDVNLSALALVDTSGDRGGEIQIQGKNVTLTGDAAVVSTTFGEETGGNILVVASETIEMSGDATTISTSTEGTGNAGNLTIETAKLIVRDGAYIETLSLADGNAGNLNVMASESVELIGTTSDGTIGSGLFAYAEETSTGNGGIITIETGQLIVKDGAQVSVDNFGLGQAGDLNIRAYEIVELIGESSSGSFPSGLFARLEEGSISSDGGTINIETQRLLVKDGAQISNDTSSVGNAGNLTIKATESVELLGTSFDNMFASGIFSQVFPTATGNAGVLTIETAQLIVKDGAQIVTVARSSGQGGVINLNVSDFTLLSGTSPLEDENSSSGVFVSAEPEATGNGGTLMINTPQLIVENGARISADNRGIGVGGDTTLNVNQLIVRNGGEIGAGSLVDEDAVSNERGAGGTLNINATELVEVSGSAEIDGQTVNSSIFTLAEGTGDAGDININTANLTIEDGGEITAATASTQGGNINLNIEDTLKFINDGEITATAGTEQAGGNGGNIEINSDFILAFPTDNTYKITANAFEGDGGNIDITTNSFFGSQFVEISASSEFGLDGDVAIEILEIDPTRSLTELPTEVVDVSQLIARSCLSDEDTAEVQNEFVVTGRGGLPVNPNQSLRGDAVLSAEWVTLPQQTEASSNQTSQTADTNQEIVEMRGWIVGDNGNLVLTADYTPEVVVEIPWFVPYSCNNGR